MSESSITSSQLDDIDFAEPHTKVYEHQTDVESLFRDPQSCGHASFRRHDLPGMPRSYDDQPSSHAVRVNHVRDGSDLAEMDRTMMEDQHEAPHCLDMHTIGRIQHDSGAAPDFSGSQGPNIIRSSAQSSSNSDMFALHMRDSCGNATVSVDLLSPAFTLNEHAWQQGAALGLSAAEIVTQRAVTGLGVDHSAVKFYQLKEVQAHEIRAPGQYAVQIQRSGFTLQDMEELLADNARLLETTHNSTTTLEGLQELVRAFDADRSQLYLQVAEHKADVKRLQERCRISESHARLAKQQLARSDQQRVEGQQQLEKLKQDFMDLKRMLPKRSGTSLGGAAPLSARGPGGNNPQNGAPPSKPLSARGPPPSDTHIPSTTGRHGTSRKTPRPQASDRLVQILEQLSLPQNLSKLESLLSAVDVRQP